MNVDAVITLPARRPGRKRFNLQAVREILLYRAGVPYSAVVSPAPRLWQRQRFYSEGIPASAAIASGHGCSRSWRTGMAQPAGTSVDIAPGRAGVGLPCRRDVIGKVGAGWPAQALWCILPGMWWPLSNSCWGPRKGGTFIIYVRPAIRRRPLSADGRELSVCRLCILVTAPGRLPGKIVDGNVSAMSWGFESPVDPIRW